MTVIVPWSSSPIRARVWRMSRVPKVAKMAMIPRAKPTSPTRLTTNAFFAARAALRRRYQKPMRR